LGGGRNGLDATGVATKYCFHPLQFIGPTVQGGQQGVGQVLGDTGAVGVGQDQPGGLLQCYFTTGGLFFLARANGHCPGYFGHRWIVLN
jgi:hypothetical protein